MDQDRDNVITILHGNWSTYTTDEGTGNRVTDTSGTNVTSSGDITHWFLMLSRQFGKQNMTTGAGGYSSETSLG